MADSHLHSSVYDLKDLVTIRVVQADGKTKDFPAIRPLLRWHSLYFRDALDEKFLEDDSRVLTLKSDIKPFASLMHWCYTRKIADFEDVAPPFLDLCKIWVLAESLNMPAAMNATIDALYEVLPSNSHINSNVMLYVVSNTRKHGSFLRDLIRHWIQCISERHMVNLLKDALYMTNLMVFYLEARTEIWNYLSSDDQLDVERKDLHAWWARSDRCKFHEHDEAAIRSIDL